MAEMGEVNKFMAEIIRLLTDLVQAVKRNEDLITDTQTILKNTQAMVEGITTSAGMQNIMNLSQSLETAILKLQKNVQTMEIHSALRQVQEFIGAMGSPGPGGQTAGVQVITQQGAPATAPQGGAPAQKSGEDSLIKPSDLFK